MNELMISRIIKLAGDIVSGSSYCDVFAVINK